MQITDKELELVKLAVSVYLDEYGWRIKESDDQRSKDMLALAQKLGLEV